MVGVMSFWPVLARVQATKLAPPSVDAQAKSLKTVKEAFKKDYGKPTSVDAVALANKLFDACIETKDSPTDRYVLFTESRDAAVRGGDVVATVRAIDQIANEFAIDAIAMKAKSLPDIVKVTALPTANIALAEAIIAAVEEAISADQYVVAKQLLTAAKPVAKKAIDQPLAVKLDLCAKTLATVQKRFEEIKPARHAQEIASRPRG